MRSSPRKKKNLTKDDDDEDMHPSKKAHVINDSSSSSDSDDDAENEPKPISSSDSDSDDEDDNERSASSSETATCSRLYSPHRTLGVISSGVPFHLMHHENSESSMVCLPIGRRFVLMGMNSLDTPMVSEEVAIARELRKNRNRDVNPNSSNIAAIVADSTLSIAVAAHGRGGGQSVTLFQRTKPVATKCLIRSRGVSDEDDDDDDDDDSARCVALLHLGRMMVPMRGEKKGTKENAAIIAVVYGNRTTRDSEMMKITKKGAESDDENDGSRQNNRVVILLATRFTLQVHEELPLDSIIGSGFCPTIAMHPATYVNKIVVGGCTSIRENDTRHPKASGRRRKTVVRHRATLHLVNIRSRKCIHSFRCLPAAKEDDGKDADYQITAVEQSPAVDTVAVGTSTGQVHLINLRHDQLLFTLHHSSDIQSVVGVTCLSFRTDASALQYGIAPMAVGRTDGTISVWDLQPPEADSGNSYSSERVILTEMTRVHEGGVAQIMYLPREPLLVSIGTTSNSILQHIFDNPDHSGRLLRSRRGHSHPPNVVRYLHSTGGIRPMHDGTDAHACQILSGGGELDRSLRVFSTARSVLDKEYSQGRGLGKRAKHLQIDERDLKLPPIKGLAVSQVRSNDWGNVVTLHQDHSFCYVWSSARGSQSGPILRQPHWNVSNRKTPPPPDTHAASVCISTCGHFCLVGTRGGIIYKYNMQSGHARGQYPAVAKDGSSKSNRKARLAGNVQRTMKTLEKHMKVSNRASNLDKEEQDAVQSATDRAKLVRKLSNASHVGYAVTGVAVDSVNKTVLSVGMDGKLIVWNFLTYSPHKSSPYELPAAATKLCHVKDSDLAAIALDDFSVVLFDCAALRIVRRFGHAATPSIGDAPVVGHVGPITDFGFTPDGRGLLTASLDCTIRVWDVPTNKCVDWMSFSRAPTSITVSPTGEYVATTHQGEVGICIWSDRSYYQTVHLDGANLGSPTRMDQPVPRASDDTETTPMATDGETRTKPKNSRSGSSEQEDEAQTAGIIPATPKEDGLITLSGLAPSHWKNLFHLELIKERNKPSEAPKKPPTAPFFLQWRSGEPFASTNSAEATNNGKEGAANADDNDWAAAWSEDDGDYEQDDSGRLTKRANEEVPATTSGQLVKRPKVTHYRSKLADQLQECSTYSPLDSASLSQKYGAVTKYVGQLGPSAIDVELLSLCHGSHDLEEGFPLLLEAGRWLVSASRSRHRYEAIQAYLHRFLHHHQETLLEAMSKGSLSSSEDYLENGGATESLIGNEYWNEMRQVLRDLRQAQGDAHEELQGRMQNTLCLLRHFSRMV